MENLFYNCIGGIDKYQTGDLLTARVKSLPLIFHKGLIVLEENQVYVWHNTPMYKNQFGGSVIKETLQDWLKSRTITKCEKTDLDKTEIETLSNQMKHKPFHLLNFNCEQYVFLIKDKVSKSPQLRFWAFTSITALILFAVFKNKKLS